MGSWTRVGALVREPQPPHLCNGDAAVGLQSCTQMSAEEVVVIAHRVLPRAQGLLHVVAVWAQPVYSAGEALKAESGSAKDKAQSQPIISASDNDIGRFF